MRTFVFTTKKQLPVNASEISSSDEKVTTSALAAKVLNPPDLLVPR